jgi:hypothetical protein
MRVRLQSLIACPTFVGRPGDIIDVAEGVARAWVMGGYAESLEVVQPEQLAEDTSSGTNSNTRRRRSSNNR